MSWQNRIKISELLLKQFKQLKPHDVQDGLFQNCDKIVESYKDKQFKDKTEEQKQSYTIYGMNEILQLCATICYSVEKQVNPPPPVYMTRKQAIQKLLQQYEKDLKQGKTQIASLNIDEWLEDNSIVIIDEK